MENKSSYNSESEINLLELFKIILKEKKTVIRFIIFFGMVGLFIAVFSEKEYTASVTVVPQVSKNKIGGDLGGLAAIAGINLGGGSTENIPPSLYPEIIESVLFKKELLKTSLKLSYIEEEITYQEYYKRYKKYNILSLIRSYTIGLPSKVFGLFKEKHKDIAKLEKDSISRISIEESILFSQLDKQLLLDINSKEGFVKITFSMPEALASAQMTQKVQFLLQEAVTNFKVQKTKEEFKFIKERYIEIKRDFEKKQAVLAVFRDRNQGLITSKSQSRLESLRSEYNLAYNIYTELAKQLETQKIKLKEHTPVFIVINPIVVPIKTSNSKKKKLLMFLVLGVISGIGFVFIKREYKIIKEKMI